jgi:hypothetical protein
MKEQKDLSGLRRFYGDIHDYGEEALAREAAECNPADKKKLQEIDCRRKNLEDLRMITLRAIRQLESDPGRYFTCEALKLKLNWEPDVDGRIVDPGWALTKKDGWPEKYEHYVFLELLQWLEAARPMIAFEQTKQERDNWKALAEDAVRAAIVAGANIDILMHKHGPLLSSLVEESSEPF